MWLDLDGQGALHQQVYRGLRQAILGGVLRPGTRLPATRSLARELGVSRNTLLHAYEQLRDEGYVVAQTGSGTTVAEVLPEDGLPTSAGTPGPCLH
ncbi:MAG: GntR family transcriptional regulator, partial [Myxococcota bacterium]